MNMLDTLQELVSNNLDEDLDDLCALLHYCPAAPDGFDPTVYFAPPCTTWSTAHNINTMYHWERNINTVDSDDTDESQCSTDVPSSDDNISTAEEVP